MSALLVVVATTDIGEQLATRAFADRDDVETERGELSLKQAEAVGNEFFGQTSSVGDKVVFPRLDPATSTIQVAMRSPLDDDETAQIERVAEDAQAHVEVHVHTGIDGGSAD